jgi:hypothetical protein
MTVVYVELLTLSSLRVMALGRTVRAGLGHENFAGRRIS